MERFPTCDYRGEPLASGPQAPGKAASQPAPQSPKKDAAPKKEAAPKKGASPKASPAAAPAKGTALTKGDLEAQITSVGDQVRVLKEKLKAEGITGKKLNDHDEVKALVAQLQDLKT